MYPPPRVVQSVLRRDDIKDTSTAKELCNYAYQYNVRSFFEVTLVCVKRMDDDAVQECGFCGASASVFCSRCDEAYCQGCSERRHSLAGKRDHKVQQLKRTTVEAESITDLVDDAANEGNSIWRPA